VTLILMGSATDLSILWCFQHGMTTGSYVITCLEGSCWKWRPYCCKWPFSSLSPI
jgi:hypothetical protein